MATWLSVLFWVLGWLALGCAAGLAIELWRERVRRG